MRVASKRQKSKGIKGPSPRNFIAQRSGEGDHGKSIPVFIAGQQLVDDHFHPLISFQIEEPYLGTPGAYWDVHLPYLRWTHYQEEYNAWRLGKPQPSLPKEVAAQKGRTKEKENGCLQLVHAIFAIFRQVLCVEQALYPLWMLRQRTQRTHEPAISQLPLLHLGAG